MHIYYTIATDTKFLVPLLWLLFQLFNKLKNRMRRSCKQDCKTVLTTLPWWWLGYRILISIKFCELCFEFLQELWMIWEAIIKNSKECFIRYPNTLKSVEKKLGCASFFQPTSSRLDILMKHSFSCLMYYFPSWCGHHEESCQKVVKNKSKILWQCCGMQHCKFKSSI